MVKRLMKISRNRNQLSIGSKVEREHLSTFRDLKRYYKKNKRFPSNKFFTSSIAKDHLKEDKKYYSKLLKAKL